MVNMLKENVVNTMSDKPIKDNTLAPNLSNNLPVIGDMIPITTAPGNINKPEWNGEMPLTSCTYKGVKIIPENIDAEITTEMTDDKANIRKRYILKSNIGSSILNCRKMKMISAIVPIVIGTYTWNELHPWSPTELKPYNNPPNARLDRISDTISKVISFVGVKFRKRKIA